MYMYNKLLLETAFISSLVTANTDADVTGDCIVKEKHILQRRRNNFSFWEWFYACLRLVEEKFKTEWQKG